MLQLFLVPSLSSFRSSSTPEEDLNILQQPFVATVVCVFCLFPSVLHCLLALFGPVDHIFSKNFMVRGCCVYHCICNGGVCNPVVYALHRNAPLSCFSLQQVFHNWCNTDCDICCMWDGGCKRFFIANICKDLVRIYLFYLFWSFTHL